MEEIWKDVIGYEGHYKVSNLGNVKSIFRMAKHYKGVNWSKIANKWCSRIRIKSERIFLGYFTNEYEAHLAYQNKLKEVI